MNYQCLPLSPQHDQYTVPSGGASWLTGTEYRTEGYQTRFQASTDYQNVPCARCYSNRSAVMMLPARRDCPSGWTREYYGTL